MKKRLIIFAILISLLAITNLYSENIKINFIQENGAKIEKEYDSLKEILVLFDSETMKTISFEIPNICKNVKVLELQNLAFIKNLDFLEKFPNIKELYIGYGVNFSSINLKYLKNLEFVEIANKRIILK